MSSAAPRRPLRGPRSAALLALALAAAPARGSIARYAAPEDLARGAPLVVEGSVATSRSALDPLTGSLATYTTIDVESVHRGPRAFERVVIREPGGSYGEIAHEVDAVPTYHAGERVLVFLEAAPDGALRTSAMFLGKFSIVEDERGARWATRDLDGHGLLPRAEAPPVERMPRSDLVAVVASVPWRGARRVDGASPPPQPRATPPELERLLWSDEEPSREATGGVVARFQTLSGANPTRWFQVDSGTAIKLHVEPARNPLGDDAAAVAAMVRAMDAWTAVPEGRVTLRPGDTDYDFTGTHALSPAKASSGLNIVLFGDPYEDIPDPTGCSGILAIGGYWRTSGLAGTVNGTAFHSALSMYVVFNDQFECFLGDTDDLAEIATHEIGHGLGFGHSVAADAIMRSSAYGDRGARLGDDDRDAAHCVYPHTLTLLVPNGGEAWGAGTLRTPTWSASVEDGPDPGVVALEHSTDGGASWTRIATGTPNDGQWAWSVPDLPGSNHRLRILRPNRGTNAPVSFPAACSADTSSAPFTITPHLPRAGVVPDGTLSGGGLTLDRGFAGALVLGWTASCSAEATDYAVYEGSLDALRQGIWDHTPATCSTSGDPWAVLTPAPGNRFFLIAATASGQEGSLGSTAGGTERPASTAACFPRETVSSCD